MGGIIWAIAESLGFLHEHDYGPECSLRQCFSNWTDDMNYSPNPNPPR